MLTVAAFALAGAGFTLIPQQFFPSSDRPEILADLWLPEGASYKETEAQALKLEQRLLADADVGSVTVVCRRWHSPVLPSARPAAQEPEFRAVPGHAESFQRPRRVIGAYAQPFLRADFPGVRFKVDRLFLGPPVGWPVQLRVQGPDRGEVRRIADEVKRVAAAHRQVFNAA